MNRRELFGTLAAAVVAPKAIKAIEVPPIIVRAPRRFTITKGQVLDLTMLHDRLVELSPDGTWREIQ